MINPRDQPHSTPSRFSTRHELPIIAMRKSYVRDLLDWRKDVNRLQKVSGETEETSKAGTGHGESLVGTGSWDDAGWGWGSGSWGSGTNSSSGGRGWCSWGGAVGVDWGRASRDGGLDTNGTAGDNNGGAGDNGRSAGGGTIEHVSKLLNRLLLETVRGTRSCSTLSWWCKLAC